MDQRITISLLDQREIEANILGPIIRMLVVELGEERARALLQNVVREQARIGGCAAAGFFGGNGIDHLMKAVERWQANEALTLEILQKDEATLNFNVTRCRFAEMYHRLGLGDWGGILSCSRDASMIEGFNPEISFSRTQTIMEGASFCDFRYREKTI